MYFSKKLLYFIKKWHSIINFIKYLIFIQFFYFKCDKLENYKELDEVLKAYFEFRKSKGISSSFIFLDEITFPTEWFRTIKYYIDVGEFRKDVLILTGSLSMYLKKEVELFPGRRGFGKDFVMLPLSFREFIKVFSPELYEKLPRIEKLEKDEIFNKIYAAMPFFDEVQKLFEKYIAIGGFPLAVKNESITESVKETYWSWVKNDIAKIGRSEKTLRRVAKAIIERTPSPISLNSVAKEFEIGTHKTVFEYLDIMEKLYIIKILYYFDLHKAMVSFKKNRKVYFIDPFFFHLFADICFSKTPDESIIIENIVGSHLARKYDVFYWKNKQEIDVVVRSGDLNGFEVKWKEKVSNYSQLKIGKLKNVFCLTRDEINKEKNILPTSLFLSLI